MHPIELLAPARDFSSGIAAINAGADAVYIAGERFGARKAAGNTIRDIGSLIRYAHKYWARVYLALNTLLLDEEIEEAVKWIKDTWNEGIDGIIIQDMGLLECNLPPVKLIASTQVDCRTPEKISFLEKCGFKRAILARELSLEEIRNIRQCTSLELEVFIHGALCVSYSGQCYLSAHMTGRSANRGVCAQVCRLPWILEDRHGNTLIRDKHLLSLKDLKLDDHLFELLEAGVHSFKIEGRLKDETYVRNVVSYYRTRFDHILSSENKWMKSSSGAVQIGFRPDPEKTFNRGFTSYFLKRSVGAISSMDTPKAQGKYVGQIISVGKGWFKLDESVPFKNGDGLCFYNDQMVLDGFFINDIKGDRIFPHAPENLKPGIKLYRNLDKNFEKQINQGIERRIKAWITVDFEESPLHISIKDEDGIQFDLGIEEDFPLAEQPLKSIETIQGQMKKAGDSIFIIEKVMVEGERILFIPVARLNFWRRTLMEELTRKRQQNHIQQSYNMNPTSHPFISETMDYSGNVLNKYALSFYRRHGVKEIRMGFELAPTPDASLMTMRYCLKREMDSCPKEKNRKGKMTDGPFYIRHQGSRYRLIFDCRKCEMRILTEDSMENKR